MAEWAALKGRDVGRGSRRQDSPQAADEKLRGKAGLAAKAGRGKAVALRRTFPKNRDIRLFLLKLYNLG